MCGIAGIVYFNNREKGKKELSQILALIKSRGPDGSGFNASESSVKLGMNRLAIIDLKGGMQPLYSEDKSIEIIGNGEIYNYIEIQKSVVKRGHKLSTGSDIETAIHLYEDYGKTFVKKLRGMFALALYDKNKQKLFLFRDRFGEKPLYYYFDNNVFAFASEFKAMLGLKEVKKEPDFDAIDSYFHHYFITEPQTAIKGVRKLQSGTFLELDLKTKTSKVEIYNDFSDIKPTVNGDPSKKLLVTLKESCRITLRSDVPVGIALSGGLDSGSILALSAPFYKDKMKAFTVGYEGTPKTDERIWASYLAKKFNVEHIFDEIKTGEFVKDFSGLVYQADDPIADIAGYSIYRVAKMARQNDIKVLLSGLGGDELFWGYQWVRNVTHENLSNSGSGKNPSFYEKVSAYKDAQRFIKNLYTGEFADKLNSEKQKKIIKTTNELKNAKNSMDKIRDGWLISNCIALNDRLAMASSVELRAPLLDYKLAEIAYSSIDNVKAYQKGNKYYLKKALTGVVPQEYLSLPKRGFTPPVYSWLKGLLNEYVYLLTDGELVNMGILSPVKIKFLSKFWRLMPLQWYMFYQLLVMEMWLRKFVKGEK